MHSLIPKVYIEYGHVLGAGIQWWAEQMQPQEPGLPSTLSSLRSHQQETTAPSATLTLSPSILPCSLQG